MSAELRRLRLGEIVPDEVKMRVVSWGEATGCDLGDHPVARRLPSAITTPLGSSPATTPSALIAIDLFAGAGGLSQGFRDAGFEVAQAVEKDPNAMATYSANHPSTDILCADIRTLNPAECLRRIRVNPGEVTILIGGPPCQGFSESNRRTRTLANPQNHLYREFLRLFPLHQSRMASYGECRRATDHVEGADPRANPRLH